MPPPTPTGASPTGGKGGYDRAIADFDEAIKLNPNDANAYYNRGLAYKKKGDKEQAIADFRKALEIDPSYQKAKIILKALGVSPEQDWPLARRSLWTVVSGDQPSSI